MSEISVGRSKVFRQIRFKESLSQSGQSSSFVQQRGNSFSGENISDEANAHIARMIGVHGQFEECCEGIETVGVRLGQGEIEGLINNKIDRTNQKKKLRNVMKRQIHDEQRERR